MDMSKEDTSYKRIISRFSFAHISTFSCDRRVGTVSNNMRQ